MASGLGVALGLAVSNTWAQIIAKIKEVINRGTLNWSASNTTYSVPAGYYPGGTLDSRPSYTNGYNAGVTAADNRANANSVNYKTGYNAGVAAGKASVTSNTVGFTHVAVNSGGGTNIDYTIQIPSGSKSCIITAVTSNGNKTHMLVNGTVDDTWDTDEISIGGSSGIVLRTKKMSLSGVASLGIHTQRWGTNTAVALSLTVVWF